MHFHSSVLHYLFALVYGLMIYAEARAFKAKARQSQGKAKKFGLKAETNIPEQYIMLIML